MDLIEAVLGRLTIGECYALALALCAIGMVFVPDSWLAWLERR